MGRWGWLLLAALLLGGRVGVAATGPGGHRAYVRQFGPAEGLRQPFIYCLLQDQQGYLWLGTAEGLVRYDGSRFVTFGQRDGLAEDFVTSLWQDPATGYLWATHAQGGRSVRRAAGQAWEPAPATLAGGPRPTGIPVPDTARLGRYQRRYALGLPATVSLTCLLADREGNTWLGTAGQGLWRHSDKYLSLWPKPAGPAGAGLVLASLPLAGALPQVWGTFNNSPFYQLPGGTSDAVKVARMGTAPLPGAPATALLARPAALGGGFWLGTGGAGVWAVAAPGQAAQPVPGLSLALGSAVTALAYAPGSGLWVGTAADGIYLLPTAAGAAVRHFTTATGLLHNSIYALLADHTGRVWVATHNTGFGVWEPAQGRFAYTRLAAEGLDANALAETTDGTIWVGTEGQGLYYCPAGTGGWQHLTAAAGLPNDYFTALLPLPAGGTGPARLLLVHPQGLSILDLRTRAATPLAAPADELVQDCQAATALAAGPTALAWVATPRGPAAPRPGRAGRRTPKSGRGRRARPGLRGGGGRWGAAPGHGAGRASGPRPPRQLHVSGHQPGGRSGGRLAVSLPAARPGRRVEPAQQRGRGAVCGPAGGALRAGGTGAGAARRTLEPGLEQ